MEHCPLPPPLPVTALACPPVSFGLSTSPTVPHNPPSKEHQTQQSSSGSRVYGVQCLSEAPLSLPPNILRKKLAPHHYACGPQHKTGHPETQSPDCDALLGAPVRAAEHSVEVGPTRQTHLYCITAHTRCMIHHHGRKPRCGHRPQHSPW